MKSWRTRVGEHRRKLRREKDSPCLVILRSMSSTYPLTTTLMNRKYFHCNTKNHTMIIADRYRLWESTDTTQNEPWHPLTTLMLIGDPQIRVKTWWYAFKNTEPRVKKSEETQKPSYYKLCLYTCTKNRAFLCGCKTCIYVRTTSTSYAFNPSKMASGSSARRTRPCCRALLRYAGAAISSGKWKRSVETATDVRREVKGGALVNGMMSFVGDTRKKTDRVTTPASIATISLSHSVCSVDTVSCRQAK